MRLTVRHLLLYITFVCVMLALTRRPFLAGCALLVGGLVAANFLIPTRTWRFVAYGAVAGIAAASVVLQVYLEFGIQGIHRKGDGRLEIFESMRPYVVHLGALVGASVGLAIFKVPLCPSPGSEYGK